MGCSAGEMIKEAFMKRTRKYLFVLMLLFTGGCIGHVLRDYHTFQADRNVYESAGISWDTAWHDRLMLDVKWYVGIMAILVIAWTILLIMGRRRYDLKFTGVSEDAKYGIKASRRMK